MDHAGALTSSIGRAALSRTADHQYLAGDGQAFATLHETYEGRAFNLCLRITNSREDAADAVQDAFLNVMRRLPEIGDRELNFGSYLSTAARNACDDLMAKSKRSDPTDEIPETAAQMSGGEEEEGEAQEGRQCRAGRREPRSAGRGATGGGGAAGPHRRLSGLSAHARPALLSLSAPSRPSR